MEWSGTQLTELMEENRPRVRAVLRSLAGEGADLPDGARGEEGEKDLRPVEGRHGEEVEDEETVEDWELKTKAAKGLGQRA